VVLDRRRGVNLRARILKAPGDTLIFAAAKASGARQVEEKLGTARIERVRVVRGHLDLRRVFARLAELEVNEVLVEAGPRLSGALLAAGLVDEWLVYLAPKLLGKDARPLAALAKLTRLRDAPHFEMREATTVGPDVRLRLRPGKRG